MKLTRPGWLVISGAAASLGLAPHACVPADTRPAPGSLTITVSPSDAIVSGFESADGWSVRFERVLLGIGQTSLTDDCISYSEANYDRVLDLASVDAGQKLSILHGLGTCDLRFRISPPSVDALLGQGVLEDDKTAMRTPGADPYVPLGGISADIAGTATKDATAKHFHFTFRPRIRFRQCTSDPDAGAYGAEIRPVDLQTNVDLTYDLRIEAEALFRDNTTAPAALRFAPFASADTNGDDNITLDELRQVPISDVQDGGPLEASTYLFDDEAGITLNGAPVPITTLADYVYLVLLPLLPRFRDTGVCVGNVQLGLGRRN
jgi:hypothetical protein